jgi:antitoxin YefM
MTVPPPRPDQLFAGVEKAYLHERRPWRTLRRTPSCTEWGSTVKVLTITDVRKNFAAVVDSVIDDAEECVIPRGGGNAVVIVSLDEWNAMNETLHVLGSASNARRLLESIAQADAGLLEEHPLVDPEAPASPAAREAA